MKQFLIAALSLITLGSAFGQIPDQVLFGKISTLQALADASSFDVSVISSEGAEAVTEHRELTKLQCIEDLKVAVNSVSVPLKISLFTREANRHRPSEPR